MPNVGNQPANFNPLMNDLLAYLQKAYQNQQENLRVDDTTTRSATKQVSSGKFLP